MPLTKDTTCGFWIFKGKFLQRFANKNSYVILYGIVGCVFSMTYAYFNGTITTIEKRFKIPSRNTGIISVGNDISQLILAAVLSYYGGKGHRPRWIGFGLMTIVIFCLLTALPHFIYGPGEDALSLTSEFGSHLDENSTLEVLEAQRNKLLCRERDGAQCEESEGNFSPQVILFIGQFISGIGCTLYYTLGVAYMDDNTKKSKTPALLSLSYFMRMLGPALGYALASFCLRYYIALDLHPTINNKDPRWLGAWWLGWLIIGALLFFSGLLLTMFPKELPKSAARRLEANKANLEKQVDETVLLESPPPPSLKDMMKTFKTLVANKTLMCNNLSSIFYFFGYMPYWMFTPKYIEIIYRQSASTSSLVTGTVALAFSALGILGAGFVITKFKPTARYMAAWNVIVGFLTVFGILSYSLIGCPGNESSMVVNIPQPNLLEPTCNSACRCDYVPYTPVCGEDGLTYISPCHAGCKKQLSVNEKKIYYDCGCIGKTVRNYTDPIFERLMEPSTTLIPEHTVKLQDIFGNQATTGACPVNCFNQFVTFLAVMCCLKFIGSSGRATNFLVSVRCVPEKDKTVAMGLGMMMLSLFAFIPSPIFFGWVLDRLCLVWGKTCTHKGNCWLYNPESLRFMLNVVAACFVVIGSIFDIGVWYFVKDLKIFDDEEEKDNGKGIQNKAFVEMYVQKDVGVEEKKPET